MKRPASPRPRSASARRRRRMRWPMCSRPCICSTAASCRWRGCWPAISTTARRCNPPPARPGGSPASSRSAARTTASAPRPRPATRSRSASSTRSRPATRCRAARPRRPRWRSVEPTPPVLAMSLAATDRKDDVKLGQALLRLNEEDPSLTMIHNPQTHDIVLWGQGEMHLRVALERLQRPLRRQRQIAAAGDRLSGDHPQIDHPARPPQEAVRRPWPVRRRGAGDQADAARHAASNSTKRSSAARCRATISARWKRAWSTA